MSHPDAFIVGGVMEFGDRSWPANRLSAELAAEHRVSDDVYALDWLHLHRRDEDDEITTLGRRWLTRAIWHLENRVETELRKQR